MKRGHTIDSYKKKIDRVRSSTRDIALTTDVIPASRVGTVISVGALCGNLSGMTVLWVASRTIGKFGYGPWLALAAVAYLLALAWIRRLVPRDIEEVAAIA